MSTTAHDSRYLPIKPDPRARVRLFCLPYAGGGASLFRGWVKRLGPAVNVCPVQLPGREDRLREPPFTDLDPLLDDLLRVLRPHLHEPYALFGYSMGALIAFELTRRLTREGLNGPVHLIAAAARAPQRPKPRPLLSELPDEEFLKVLAERYDGLRSAVLQNAELLALFLPTLRADCRLLDTYQYADGAPLDCPLSAWGGQQDPVANQAELAAWNELTRGEFAVRVFPGGHFFLNDAQEMLWPAISAALRV